MTPEQSADPEYLRRRVAELERHLKTTNADRDMWRVRAEQVEKQLGQQPVVPPPKKSGLPEPVVTEQDRERIRRAFPETHEP